ncbi:MAG TPA: Ig-like domain-containing protein [Gemmatimonadales bacterium]|nr:Ig-like domain-containing protein [Gemmatimonadales bacterium]
MDALQIPSAEGDTAWSDLVDRLRRATAGEFEIGRELGRGGMAAVFLAHEIALDRSVAIKVMSPALLLGEGMVDRFRHEAITIANLHHPNIVSVYSVRQAEGLHFFVMQYVQGRSLDQILHRGGALPLPIVRSILHQVGSALAYAHRRRIIHRDIKPGNILVDGEGNAVVTDFGIAKAAESPTHTMTGALVGTPAYMSPEQCRGTEVSGASDQYSLGAVAYEMLAGVPPFGGSTFTVLQAHVERPPLPLRELTGECPPEIEAAVLRMLAKDPAARWPRIADAMAALGTEPLADDDPLRAELARRAALAAGPAAPPVSLVPRSASGSRGLREATGPVGSVAILPPPAGLEVGDSFVLVALVRGQRGTRLPPGMVSWTTDAPGILKLESGGGVALAVGAGSAVLTASCKGVRATLAVEVLPPRADEIAIEPPERGVRAGDELRLEASARDKRGQRIDRPVKWESADPATASVEPDGALQALAPGLARVTAVLDEARATIAIPVLPARVAAIRIAPPEPVVVGGTLALSVTTVDRWGSPLADRLVVWSSSDVKIAVVAAGGRVHALRAGSVVLTASCEGITESVKVTVDAASPPRAEAPATEFPVEPPPRRRRSRRHRARRVLAALTGVALGLTGSWLIGRGNPPPVRPVSAEPPAPAAYTATMARGEPVVAITASPGRALRPPATFQLAAEVRGPDGHPAPDAKIEWSSSDPAVVAVDPSTGRITAVSPGNAQVVAASGSSRDSAPVAVRPALPRARAAGSLGITEPGPVRVGDIVMLEAVLRDTRGAPLTDSTVTWRSTNRAVATVDSATGRLTAYAPGPTVIIAHGGGQTALLELAVLPVAVADVIVHGVPPLVVGQSVTLVAIPTDADGNSLNDRRVSWTSSDPDVLAVDEATGVITGRSPGSVDVTASSEGSSGRVRITVFAPDAGASERAGDDGITAGVDACYAAIQSKDVSRVERLYQPVTRTDEDNLKRFRRVLRTRNWFALVGQRVDGDRKVSGAVATQDFSFRLVWKDDAGARHSSDPVFRAEFTRQAGRWTMTSCRILGTPEL